METTSQKFKKMIAIPGLWGLTMVAVASFNLSVGSRTAYAESEQLSGNTPAQTQIISLEGYSPDQSLWSPKMIAKYETARHTEETPLALLKIDRLNLEAPIYYGTKRITLDRGLGFIEGTAGLDEIGNIGLSGHRDSFFRVLKDIEVGDSIEMQTLEGIQNFQVSSIFIVDALEVSVLDPTDTTVLTLITCHPFYYVGYAPNRYIVRATPVGESLNGGEQNPVLGATRQANSGIQ